MNTMTQVCGVHSVTQIFIVVGFDADAMPAIDELILLINLNRRQRVEDIRILRDQVVALTEPGVQIFPEYDVVESDHLWGVHTAIVA